MKICGLVTEYNPFHNGHVHHMKEARKKSGADYVVVCMSGDFVQRGTPASIDQYERTAMALHQGADLVLQIPVLFSTSAAEVFSTAAINLLNQLGCVDTFCYGTEAGDLSVLQTVAELLNHEPASLSSSIREYQKNGQSYPAARSLALQQYFGDRFPDLSDIHHRA